MSVDRRNRLRRRTDRMAAYTQGFRAQIVRDLVLVIVSGLVLIAVVSLASTSSQVAAQAVRIQEGRRVGTAFTCAALSAVSLAGQKVIVASGASSETSLTRFLEQHGYPPPRVRERQSADAARAYQAEINRRIIMTIGPRAKGLVRKDGTFDCARLALLSVVGPS